MAKSREERNEDQKVYHHKRRKEHPELYRDIDHRKHHHEPYENKQKRLEKQGFRCANPGCRTTEPGGKHNQWNTDHNHNTGEIRGELCDGCNRALGFLKEDAFRIEGLAEYIRKHKT